MTANQSKYVSETIFKRGPTKNAALVEGVQGGGPELLWNKLHIGIMGGRQTIQDPPI